MAVIVGILLEVLATSLGTISKQLIAYSNHIESFSVFLLGAILNVIVGPAIDASAYLFAPQIVVAPFGCLDVVLNAITAPYTLAYQQESCKFRTLGAALMVTLGAMLTAVLCSANEVVHTKETFEEKLLRPLTLVYVVAQGLLIWSLYNLLEFRRLPGKYRGIALGVAAGVSMSNVFFMKGILLLVRLGDWSSFTRPLPYILSAGAAGGAIMGHIFMKWGLREYTATYMITIFQGSNMCAVSLSGCLVMGEMADTSWLRCVYYWSSVTFIIAGIALINQSAGECRLPVKQADKSKAAADEEEPFEANARRKGMVHYASKAQAPTTSDR